MNRCFFVKSKRNQFDHVLHCAKSRILWEMFSLFGVVWVLHSTVREALLNWYGSFVGRKQKKVSKATPLCIFWTLWKERNRQAFEDNKISDQKLKCLSRVSFFRWEATWGKALTLDQLQKRGWPLANRCYLCKRHEESIDLILLHCAKARTLWTLLCSLFGMQWVLPATVKVTLLGWDGSFVGKKRKGV